MLEYTDFMTNLFCRGEIDSACGHIRRRYLNLHRVSNRQPAAAPDIRMGQQAVELEFAVRKVLHAYKALHAVYKLDKIPRAVAPLTIPSKVSPKCRRIYSAI